MYLQLDSTQYCQFDFLMTLKKHPETDKLYYVQLSHHVDKGGGISDNVVSLEFKNSSKENGMHQKLLKCYPKTQIPLAKNTFQRKIYSVSSSFQNPEVWIDIRYQSFGIPKMFYTTQEG